MELNLQSVPISHVCIRPIFNSPCLPPFESSSRHNRSEIGSGEKGGGVKLQIMGTCRGFPDHFISLLRTFYTPYGRVLVGDHQGRCRQIPKGMLRRLVTMIICTDITAEKCWTTANNKGTLMLDITITRRKTQILYSPSFMAWSLSYSPCCCICVGKFQPA